MTSPRNLDVKIFGAAADSYQMGILGAMVLAATMIVITFAWQLTFEIEALEDL